MKALDLCCGLGGMSDGMAAAGFRVWGIDIVKVPGYGHTFIKADIRDLALGVKSLDWKFDWIHVSPPCQRFSLARAGRVKDPPTEADLELLKCALRIRDVLKPRFWTVENVRGAVPWFSPLLGEPRLVHGPFYIWGNFPPFLSEASGLIKGIHGSKSPITKALGRQTKPKNPWLSAKLPIELTRPMARAVASALEGGAP